jgi:hypothetical protein
VAEKPYGDGLVIIVDDGLNVEVWLDGEYQVGELRLDSLDKFVTLRKLLSDVDDVAVLTRIEANEVKDMIEAASAA